MEISFNDMRQATHYIPGQQPIPEEGMGQDLGHPHHFLHTPLLSSGWRAGQYSLKRWISTPPPHAISSCSLSHGIKVAPEGC